MGENLQSLVKCNVIHVLPNNLTGYIEIGCVWNGISSRIYLKASIITLLGEFFQCLCIYVYVYVSPFWSNI